ncbi:hypothetical protein BZA05DRAFT_465151, partial [Tricharina praecox]|uniref:uncharacterized protein n=1 Tax=Tricharina praecox TaxID=43433 RepID=UPI002220DF86
PPSQIVNPHPRSPPSIHHLLNSTSSLFAPFSTMHFSAPLFLTALLGALVSTVLSQSESPDGSCGGTNAFACTAAEFGSCCSSSGFCGEGVSYCGAGCQATYSANATVCLSNPPSVDGSCGGTTGYTCTGSTWGGCCSKYGFCGTTAAYCSTVGGCQAGFGAACTLP